MHPSGVYQEPERDPPQPAQKSGLYISGDLNEIGSFTPSFSLTPQREQNVAEEDHGQCAYNPRCEADCHPLDHSS